MSITLTDFNTLSASDAQQLLKNCADISSWINSITAQRPFVSLAQFYDFAESQSHNWLWQDVKHALDQHPRIGQRQAKQALTAQEQDFSAKEQANLQFDSNTAHALAEGNIAYENQFGYIFLIRAAGRSAEQILAELRRRLNNSPDAEQQEVTQQLAQIALLRLKQEIPI